MPSNPLAVFQARSGILTLTGAKFKTARNLNHTNSKLKENEYHTNLNIHKVLF